MMNISSNNSLHHNHIESANPLSSNQPQQQTSQDCVSSRPTITSVQGGVINTSPDKHPSADSNNESGSKPLRMKIKLRNEAGETDETREVNLVGRVVTNCFTNLYYYAEVEYL